MRACKPGLHPCQTSVPWCALPYQVRPVFPVGADVALPCDAPASGTPPRSATFFILARSPSRRPSPVGTAELVAASGAAPAVAFDAKRTSAGSTVFPSLVGTVPLLVDTEAGVPGPGAVPAPTTG